MNKKLIGYAAAMFAALGAVNAQATVFQGQSANGTFDNSCTNQCVMYWDAVDNLEILNKWSIGGGFWDASAAPGSAQALAEAAGFAATGVTGWVLPTGIGNQPAGPQNQWLSMLSQLSCTDFLSCRDNSNLANQFAVGSEAANYYWTGSMSQPPSYSIINSQYYPLSPGYAWAIVPQGAIYSTNYAMYSTLSTLAVHNGQIGNDAPPPVTPIPATVWLLLSSLSGLGVFARQRKVRA